MGGVDSLQLESSKAISAIAAASCSRSLDGYMTLELITVASSCIIDMSVYVFQQELHFEKLSKDLQLIDASIGSLQLMIYIMRAVLAIVPVRPFRDWVSQ